MSNLVMKNENYYNKKCLGCGEYFSKNKSDPSYVENLKLTTKYCKRCFQFKHYKKIPSVVNDESIENVLNKLDFKNNLVILVIDLFDVINSIVEKAKESNNLVIVVNKLSCLPTKFNSRVTLMKLKEIFLDNGLNFKDIILYDSVEKRNIKKIMDKIELSTKNKKITYVIGNTNTGKSSLINALLRINKKNEQLMTSPYSNTTLGLSKIIIDKNIIIDTPGYKNENAFINKLDQKDIDKINISKSFDIRPFIIKDNNQAFLIEKLFYIKVDEISENPSITFYNKKSLKIHRSKKDKMNELLKNELLQMVEYNDKSIKLTEKTVILDPRKKYNIFINGLALVSLKNIKIISLGYPNKIKVHITEHALI